MKEEKDLNGVDLEPKSKNYLAFIIEGIIAVVAVIVIIVAITVGKNGGMGTGAGSKDLEAALVSINAIAGDMPATPDISEVNNRNFEDITAGLEKETILNLQAEDGTNVYVPNYKNKDYFVENTTASEEKIDELIKSGILANYSKQEEVNGRNVVELNDTVKIDYVGRVDGVAFDGGTGSYDLTIGSHSFIDNFEDQLIGAKVGDTVIVNVTFPENYGKEELNGKAAEFTVKINGIPYTNVEAELTDEIVTDFFSQMGENITTVDGCKEYCKNYITEYNTYNLLSDNYYVDKINDTTLKCFYVDTMEYYNSMAVQYGTTLSDLLAQGGSTIDTIKSDVIMTSAQSTLYITAIKAIAKDLNIEVTDEDLLDFVSENGFTAVEDYYATYGSKNTLQFYALEKKVIKALTELY